MSEELALLFVVAGLGLVMGTMFFLGWWVTDEVVTSWGRWTWGGGWSLLAVILIWASVIRALTG